MKLRHTVVTATLAAASALTACRGNSEAAREKDEKHSDDGIQEIVNRIMNQQYGDTFNRELGCWEYTIEVDGDRYAYCMKPGNTKIAATEHGNRLYFIAASRSDIRNSHDYRYAHSDMGLMGAFELQLNHSGEWSLLAASNDMDFGSVGDCGCEDARFVRLGKDYYGWMFTSGGVWQGIPSLYHSLIAPRDGKFVDLSEIPMQTEELGDVEYKIRIDDSDLTMQIFPLVVAKFEGGREVESIKVDFDQSRWRYALPKK